MAEDTNANVFTLQIMATNAITAMVTLFIIRKSGKVDKKLNSTQPMNQPIARMIMQITRQDCWYTKPSLALGLPSKLHLHIHMLQNN